MTQPSFWEVLSDYCAEIGPIIGPLVSAIGDTASAVDRAQKPARRTLTVSSRRVPTPKTVDAD